MTQRINQSWREQRKGVVCTDCQTGEKMEYISLWQASHEVAAAMNCKPDTARREIKKSMSTGKARYGATWTLVGDVSHGR